MPQRCSDTHFYADGHKTRSGLARYKAPDGTKLAVVCGRNRPGPGQIHLRDVPDGAKLVVRTAAGKIGLVLDHTKTRGRKGRAEFSPGLDRLEFRQRSRFVMSCAAELPASTGEGWKWGAEVVATALELVPDRDGEDYPRYLADRKRGNYARWLLEHDAFAHARFVIDKRHIRLSLQQLRADPAAWKRYTRHTNRLVHRLYQLDPVADRRAYNTALHAAVALAGGTPYLESDALWRLQSHLVQHGPATPAGRSAIHASAARMPAAVATGMARALTSSRGGPFAARARQLGLDCYGLRHEEWTAAAVLADPNAAALHRAHVAWLNSIPWENAYGAPRTAFPYTMYRYACPAGRAAWDAHASVALREAYARGAETLAVEHDPPPQDRRDAAVRSWRAHFDAAAALLESSDDPMTRAVTALRGHGGAFTTPLATVYEIPYEYEPRHYRLERYWDAGFTDIGQVERLVLDVPTSALVMGEDVGGTIALARHGVLTLDAWAALKVAGADSVPEMCQMATRHPYDAAASVLLGIDESALDALDAVGATPVDYLYFRASSLDDVQGMVERCRHLTGRTCLSLTALGVDTTNNDWTADSDLLTITTPQMEQYIRAEFDLGQIRRARQLRLLPGVVTRAHAAGVSAEAMLSPELSGSLDDLLEYMELGVKGSPAEIVSLPEHDVTEDMAMMYVRAGISSASSMLAFVRAGITDRQAVADHIAQARPQTAAALW